MAIALLVSTAAADPGAPGTGISATVRPVALQDDGPALARALEAAAALRHGGDYARAAQVYSAILTRAEAALGSGHPDLAPLLKILGEVLVQAGDHRGGESALRRALALQLQSLDPADPDIADTLGGLAAARHAAGDSAGAIPLLRRALAIQEHAFGPNDARIATTLNNLAVMLRKTEDYAGAEALYRRALDIQKKHDPHGLDVGMTLNNLALLREVVGAYAEATSLYREALAILEPGLPPGNETVAKTWNNLAELLRVRGEYEESERLHRRALAVLDSRLGDHPTVALSLNNLGALLRLQGRHDEAVQLLRRALRINEASLGPAHPDTATTVNNLALALDAMGLRAEAEPLFRRALAAREALGPRASAVATSLNDLAGFLREKGEYVEAEALHRRALAIREQVFGPRHPEVAQSLSNLALLLFETGARAEAQRLARRAQAILEQALGTEHPDLAATLNLVAVILSGVGDDVEAEAVYRRALAIQEKALREGHPRVATTLNNMALLRLSREDYADAEHLYRRALAIQEKALGLDHPSLARTLASLAVLRGLKGDTAEADALSRRALATLERSLGPDHGDVATVLLSRAARQATAGMLANAVADGTRAAAIRERAIGLVLRGGSEAQKRAYMSNLAAETHGVVSLHTRTAPSDADALRLAFTMVLQRKGRVLDAMVDQLAVVRRQVAPADEALFARWAATREQLAALVLRVPESVSPAIYRERLARLEDEAEKLDAELGARYATVREAPPSVTLDSVQRAMPPQSALVEFVAYHAFDARAQQWSTRWGDWRYVAYVLPWRGDPKWVDLGEAEPIDRLSTQFRAAVGDPAHLGVRDVARMLHTAVMRPMRDLVGEATTLLLAPDGALHLIPFGALVDEDGKYLVERSTLVYLTSGRDLLRLATRVPSRQGAVVVADPDFGQGAGARPPLPYWKALPGTTKEAEALGRLLSGAAVLTRGQATEGAVKRLRGPRLLHLATHGFFLEGRERPAASRADMEMLSDAPLDLGEHPLLRSGLALAGANAGGGDGEDGVLTALEVVGLDLRGTQIAMLSACETGVGAVRLGDGVYGLRRALVMAGAESQVMTLWRIPDDPTAELVQAYYKDLIAGKGRAAALRETQLTRLGRHPYYWAGFIHVGQWSALTP